MKIYFSEPIVTQHGKNTWIATCKMWDAAKPSFKMDLSRPGATKEEARKKLLRALRDCVKAPV